MDTEQITSSERKDSFDESSGDPTVDWSSLDQEQRRKIYEEWSAELNKTKEEIAVLKQVLKSKDEIVRQLEKKMVKAYFTGVGENIRESSVYQKTSEVVKIVGEKTTSVFGGLGGSMARKLGEVKNSNAFKSFEGRVASATGSLKERMTGLRSNSSFDESLNSSETHFTPATTPTIPEDGPVP